MVTKLISDLQVPKSCTGVSFINGVIDGLNDLVYEFGSITLAFKADVMNNKSWCTDATIDDWAAEYYRKVDELLFAIKDKVSLLRDPMFAWIDPTETESVNGKLDHILEGVNEAYQSMNMYKSHPAEYVKMLREQDEGSES